MGFLRAFRRRADAPTAPAIQPPPPPPPPPMPRALFDAARYAAQTPDVADSDPAAAYDHYIRVGHGEEIAGVRPRSLPLGAPSLGGRHHPHDAVVERLTELEGEKRLLLELWDRHRPAAPDFATLSEDVDDALVPPLDRAGCDERLLDEDQRHWREHGYVVKRGFLPDDLIDRYCALRERHPGLGGWMSPTPYMQVAEIRDLSLYPPLTTLLERLLGEEMGLHLNLTGWITTDRNWHQDDYLNPPTVNSWYAAVWMALDDIHPDSGPFEFVPGSHRWPLLRRDRVSLFLDPAERDTPSWPSIAERFVNDAAAAEIARRGARSETFVARRGDVLVWHGRLMHRGSRARVPEMPRKALISHYSGLSHRPDMPVVARTAAGSAYFIHDNPLDWDPYAA